ncbi:hypothetical protein LZ31DRAFT_553739 [Colletotrichum somersetense]|nr:hypothetical protein LZ31DRAFT_553739 [Colletotrichum somersetense]
MWAGYARRCLVRRGRSHSQPSVPAQIGTRYLDERFPWAFPIVFSRAPARAPFGMFVTPKPSPLLSRGERRLETVFRHHSNV